MNTRLREPGLGAGLDGKFRNGDIRHSGSLLLLSMIAPPVLRCTHSPDDWYSSRVNRSRRMSPGAILLQSRVELRRFKSTEQERRLYTFLLLHFRGRRRGLCYILTTSCSAWTLSGSGREQLGPQRNQNEDRAENP